MSFYCSHDNIYTSCATITRTYKSTLKLLWNLTCDKIESKFNEDGSCGKQKGGVQRYQLFKSVPMVFCITKKWLDTMIRKTRISVHHNNGPKGNPLPFPLSFPLSPLLST
jgi:hypothetical protein